jgi:hypothetical protein
MKPLTDGELPTQPVVGPLCGTDSLVGQSRNRLAHTHPVGFVQLHPNKTRPS